jgi:hypothetical protein
MGSCAIADARIETVSTGIALTNIAKRRNCHNQVTATGVATGSVVNPRRNARKFQCPMNPMAPVRPRWASD